MSNMSYCRFYNTRRDLEDCMIAVRSRFYNDGDTPPVDSEECAEFYYMVNEMIEALNEFGILKVNDEYGTVEVDRDQINKVMDLMEREEGDE